MVEGGCFLCLGGVLRGGAGSLEGWPPVLDQTEMALLRRTTHVTVVAAFLLHPVKISDSLAEDACNFCFKAGYVTSAGFEEGLWLLLYEIN